MKHFQTALLFIFLSLNGFAQQAYSSESFNIKSGAPTDWVSYLDYPDFKIEFKFSACDPPSGLDNESVLFRFTNKTNESMSLHWHLLLSYDEVCRTCAYPEEYGYELSLDPNQVLEGDCASEGNYRLKVFSKFIDAFHAKGAQLTDFKLADFTVTKI
ncbi:MAG: hypothetical protein A3D92_25185 [Bacteroidetes bacterium RIFCSPHIGHO2_02_FULL_44_7]|nr:MAG: hypothetical protein A3D92_25185 [Bacteroidetes bacterium RIFCSPHIGHO2_02_FULL_44_7]